MKIIKEVRSSELEQHTAAGWTLVPPDRAQAPAGPCDSDVIFRRWPGDFEKVPRRNVENTYLLERDVDSPIAALEKQRDEALAGQSTAKLKQLEAEEKFNDLRRRVTALFKGFDDDRKDIAPLLAK